MPGDRVVEADRGLIKPEAALLQIGNYAFTG